MELPLSLGVGTVTVPSWEGVGEAEKGFSSAGLSASLAVAENSPEEKACPVRDRNWPAKAAAPHSSSSSTPESVQL